MKCQGCGSEFELINGRGSHKRVMCYTCQPIGGDRKTTYRNKHLKRTYGITQAEYLNMFNEQGCKCKICERELTHDHSALRLGEKRIPSSCCIDHCHETNKVRGLLCFHCNTALGHVFDKPQILERMVNYLK